MPWLVELPPSPVRGHCGWILNEGRGLFLATSGDFSWPPAETSVGHQWILSHGHGQSGVGVQQFSIPISVRPTDDAAHGKSFSFDGQVNVSGLNGVGGYLARITRTQPQALRSNSKIQTALQFELSVVQVNEIESHRATGFNFNINIGVYADNGEFGSTQVLDYQVSREKWIQILEQINFRKTLLLELAIPSGSANPAMTKAVNFFGDAQRRFLEGENRQSVECLRQSLAAIVGADPANEGNDDIEADMKSARTSQVHYEERFELVRRALKLLTDLAAHPDVDETRPREARAAITMTAGILQWHLVQP